MSTFTTTAVASAAHRRMLPSVDLRQRAAAPADELSELLARWHAGWCVRRGAETRRWVR